MRTRWILVLSLVMVACGGSGAGSTPPPVPVGSVSGTVFNAPVVGGAVSVYDFTSGTKGPQLGQVTTDADGAYSIPVQAETRPILVEMTGGYYFEEAGGNAQVTLSATNSLSAVLNYTTGSKMNVSLTAYTHLAAGLATYEIRSGKDAETAIEDANQRISTLVGVNILTTAPALITDTNNASANLTPELKYGMLAGAISMWTYKHAPPAATSPHISPYASIDLAQMLYRDVSADGLLDGLGLDSAGALGQLSFGVVPLGVDVYRLGLGSAMLQMAGDANNKTELNGSKVLSYAVSYVKSTDAIFNNVAPSPLSAPVVTLSAPVVDSIISGTMNVTGLVQSVVGASSAELLIDGVGVASATVPSVPTYSFDTTSIADGVHAISVQVTDWGGQQSSSTANVVINNVAPAVTISAPISDGIVGGQISVMGTAQANVALSKVELLVDNDLVATSTTNLTAPSFQLDTTAYLDGPHTIGLRAYTIGGKVAVSSVQVNFANVAPTVVLTSPAADTLISGLMRVAAQTHSSVGLSAVEFMVDGSVVGSSTEHVSPALTIDTTPYQDGARIVGVRATDVNGLVTTTSVQVTFNNVAPVVSITSPATNAKVGGQVNVKATAQSAIALSTAELLVDNVSISTQTANLTAPAFPLNTAAYPDGSHTIGVRATSNGGLVTVGAITATFLNHPPVVTINTPAANAWVRGAINVAGTVQSDAGVSTVSLLVDNATSSAATASLTAPKFHLDTTAYSTGEHTLAVTATDVNSLATTSSVLVNIDNAPPTTNVAEGGGGCTAYLSGCASDSGSGVLSVTDSNTGSVLTLDGNKCWTVTKSCPWSPGLLYPFVVKDKVGNCATYTHDLNYGTTTLTSTGPC